MVKSKRSSKTCMIITSVGSDKFGYLDLLKGWQDVKIQLLPNLFRVARVILFKLKVAFKKTSFFTPLIIIYFKWQLCCAELRNKNGKKWQNSQEDENHQEEGGGQEAEASVEDTVEDNDTSSADHNTTDISFGSLVTNTQLSPSTSTSGNVPLPPVLSSTPLVSSSKVEGGELFVFGVCGLQHWPR